MKLVSLFFSILLLNSCTKSNTSKVVVPRDYVGPVVIIYAQSEATNQNDYNYILRENGVIKTSDQDVFGKFDLTKFYLDTISSATMIPRVFDFDRVPVAGKVVFGGRSHYALKDGSEREAVKYITYCIGNRTQIEDCYKEIDRTNYTNLN